MKVLSCTLIFFVYFVIFLTGRCDKSKKKSQKQSTKKIDINNSKGNTPFFIQDPYDQTCLGPNGFTMCNENALWLLHRRNTKSTKYSLVSLLNPNKAGYCLERKSFFFGLFGSDRITLGSCSTSGGKSWEFNFVDTNHIKLSIQGQCLVRGKKKYSNSVSLQPCKKGDGVPLLYHPTAVHEVGFYLKSADGGCLDGEKFRKCEISGKKMLWGVGVRYIWGKAHRYFFSFSEPTKCLVALGSRVEKGMQLFVVLLHLHSRNMKFSNPI